MRLLDRLRLSFKMAQMVFKQADDLPGGGSVGGLISGAQGSFPARSTDALLNSFNISPWVRACAGRVADSMASVQWRLWVARDRRTRRTLKSRQVQYLQRAVGVRNRKAIFKKVMHESDLEEVTSHLFLDVLNNPNDEMDGIEMRFINSLWLDLVGDSFFLKERNGAGAPVALWPIPPHWVVETATPSNPFYRISYRTWQSRIPADDIFWSRHRDPLNPYHRGSGVAKALSDEISIDEMAGKHSLAFLRNNARPDLLIMPKDDGTISEPDRDRLQNWWSEQLQGYWRRFKPLFMTRPMEVKVIEQNFKDMQLTQMRESESDTIMQVWGIPPEILGRLSKSNRATINEAEEIFANYCLIPRLERQRATFQRFVNMEYDDRVIVDYESPAPSDDEHSLNVYKAQPNAFSLNEWRDLAGMPPMEELDGQFGKGSSKPAIETDDKPEPEEDDGEKGIDLRRLSDAELKDLHQLVEKTEIRNPEVIK